MVQFSVNRGPWQPSDADDGDKVWPDRESALARAAESAEVSGYFTNGPLRRWRAHPADASAYAAEEQGK